ncbi:hypothetical protein GLOIN_2v1777473 [Rhizophagus irregularis DAOM 181602=DAOM 197198]|nr:hypothetical protein GLOIN_2v1777473 [Rhizophagus irregularis DAOM 181602=DAOM 197198]
MGLMGLATFPLLLQVTSTNSLESFHSELKKTTSSSHGLINAAHKVINVDCKKRSEAESASFDFCIKKIFTKACAMMNRLEKGKSMPGLTSLNCFCLFRHRYLLPCKHIFHEHMYSNKLLTTNTEQQKNAENQRIAVSELTERIRDRYWRIEEMGDVEKTQSFISMLEVSVNLIILQFDNNSSRKM